MPSPLVSAASIYPSYVDLDPLIDIGRLRSLDSYLRERIERRLAQRSDVQFYTGPFVLDRDAPSRPGSQMIYLAHSDRPDDYYDLDECERWHPSGESAEFAELMDFIDTLPFAATGRMLIMYDPEGRPVTAHRDHDSTDLCHEFIWFRTNFEKPFYMLDPETSEKCYVAGHSAWFDTVNQYHGADGTGQLAWSIRVDGRFTNDFRAQMPEASANPASRASVWAQSLV